MAEAEGSWEGGLNTPIQGRVRALQAPAPIMTGIRCTLVLIHFAPLSTEAWPAKATEAPEAVEAGPVVRAGRRGALQHLLLTACAFVTRVRAVALETVDQVETHATVRARLTLALVHVQLAACTGVAWRAHAAVGAHTVQARSSVQAGR